MRDVMYVEIKRRTVGGDSPLVLVIIHGEGIVAEASRR